MKVVIADKMSDKAITILEKEGLNVDARSSRGEATLEEIITDAEGLIIRSSTVVDEGLISKAPKLKVIGRAGIGVDNIDIKAATKAGIIVMNTPFGNSVTTAEHAISLMLSLARNIPQASKSTHKGLWEKSKFKGVEIFGKNLGIVGCGNIGSIVADRAMGLKMNVFAYDPFLTEDRANQLGVKKVDLDELCACSDFITLHTPLTKESKHLFNKERLNKVKKGAFIINAARGGLISESDLFDALNEGVISGAALDVFENEPAKENILFNHPRVILTPHLGASTVEAQENVAEQVAEQVASYLKDNEIKNALNYPSLSAHDAKKMSPYIVLAEKLGSFLGQTIKDPIEKIKISFHGEVSDFSSKPLVLKILQSFLQHKIEGINMINALEVAENRGIRVTTEKDNKDISYTTLIKITVKTTDKNHEVAGTLFNKESRFVEIFNTPLEASIGEHMIYIRNTDIPGVIGKVGTILGGKGYNIENYHLGFSKNRGEALSLICITKPLSEEVRKELKEVEPINRVVSINF